MPLRLATALADGVGWIATYHPFSPMGGHLDGIQGSCRQFLHERKRGCRHDRSSEPLSALVKREKGPEIANRIGAERNENGLEESAR